MELPNFTLLLYRVGEPNTNSLFLFLHNVNKEAFLSDSTPENLANI